MSLMVNPEQSLTQLSNITALLNGSVFQELSHIESIDENEESHFSIVPENISLTYESHLQKKTSEPGNFLDSFRKFFCFWIGAKYCKNYIFFTKLDFLMSFLPK